MLPQHFFNTSQNAERFSKQPSLVFHFLSALGLFLVEGYKKRQFLLNFNEARFRQ